MAAASTRVRAWGCLGLALLLGPSLLPGSACAPATPPPRLVVLGVDALDFRLVSQLVAAGRMPNLAALAAQGAFGSIRASDLGRKPLSPRIWTSYVTGHHPRGHGIVGMLRRGAGEPRLLTSRARRVPAIWEIAHQAGRRVGVVNWWFSHPIEPVDGFVVSDRFVAEVTARPDAPSRLAPTSSASTHPAALGLQLRDLVLDDQSQPLTGPAALELDRQFVRMAERVTAGQPVELLLVYANGLDRLSHFQWRGHDLSSPEVASGPVADFLVQWDRQLPAFLERFVGEADHFVLLSDHGFDPTPLRGVRAHVTRESADAATVLFHGPRIRPGLRIGRLDPLRILPTLLELLEIPPPTGLPRKLAPEVFVEPPPERTPTTYARMKPIESAGEAEAPSDPAEAARIERLRALGYLE